MPSMKPRKLPRVVRLDDSDVEVFPDPARPGEWAVSGGFEFLDHNPATLSGKQLQAFNCGFLGVGSFGRSTLVAITAASDADFRSVVEHLAAHLVDRYGAPDLAAAMQAAEEEGRIRCWRWNAILPTREYPSASRNSSPREPIGKQRSP